MTGSLNGLFAPNMSAWDPLPERGSMDSRGGEDAHAAAILVVDLAKAFQKVQLMAVWQWVLWFKFPRVLRVLCGYFVHQRRVRCERTFSERLSIVTAVFPRSKLSILLSSVVLQDTMTKVSGKGLRGRYQDSCWRERERDNSSKLGRRNVSDFLEHGGNTVELEFSFGKKGVEGMSKFEVSNGYLNRKLQQLCRRKELARLSISEKTKELV